MPTWVKCIQVLRRSVLDSRKHACLIISTSTIKKLIGRFLELKLNLRDGFALVIHYKIMAALKVCHSGLLRKNFLNILLQEVQLDDSFQVQCLC